MHWRTYKRKTRKIYHISILTATVNSNCFVIFISDCSNCTPVFWFHRNVCACVHRIWFCPKNEKLSVKNNLQDCRFFSSSDYFSVSEVKTLFVRMHSAVSPSRCALICCVTGCLIFFFRFHGKALYGLVCPSNLWLDVLKPLCVSVGLTRRLHEKNSQKVNSYIKKLLSLIWAQLINTDS